MPIMKFLLIITGSILISLTGCALQQDIIVLEERMVALERQNQALQHKNDSLQKQLGMSCPYWGRAVKARRRISAASMLA